LLGADSRYSPFIASHNGKTQVSTARREISIDLLMSLRHPLGQGANTCKNAGPFTSIPFLAFV